VAPDAKGACKVSALLVCDRRKQAGLQVGSGDGSHLHRVDWQLCFSTGFIAFSVSLAATERERSDGGIKPGGSHVCSVNKLIKGHLAD
jgi:hypothetical protein